MQHWLIVTDLDGTLLDDTYALGEAARVLDQIQQLDQTIRVVLASSKTLSEMQLLADQVKQPVFLIFENGSGVAWRDGSLVRGGQQMVDGYQVVKFASAYRQVCEVLELHRSLGYPFLGFSDMSDVEVAHRTGLTVPDAARARARLCSEPIVWHGHADLFNSFCASLGEYGLTVQSGGRFHHISSGSNKAAALSYLTGQLRYEQGIQPMVLACGDAPNDLELLDKADLALVFPQRCGTYIRELDSRVRHAPQAGPSYWFTAVEQILANTYPTYYAAAE